MPYCTNCNKEYPGHPEPEPEKRLCPNCVKGLKAIGEIRSAGFRMPTVRVELGGLKQGMIAAISASMDEINSFACATIAKSMDNLMEADLELHIINAMRSALRDALHKVLPEIVEAELNEYFTEGAGKQYIVNAMLKGLRGVTDESRPGPEEEA